MIRALADKSAPVAVRAALTIRLQQILDFCREVLREAGVAVAPKRGRRGYGNVLAPRELEIARLAADGLSNSRIAARLTLSVSTVEDHL